MAPPVNIILDATNLAHIAKHAYAGLSYNEAGATGVVFGFLNSLLNLYKRFGYGGRFLFAWDSKASVRRKLFPEYKQRRRARLTERDEQEIREDDAARAQMLLLHKEVLPRIGFRNSYLVRGYEADDLVAALAAELNPPSVMVSTDKDLLQCLRGGVELLNPITKRIDTEATFRAEWGIDPWDWAVVLAIAGCDTDGVPGVRGVGVSTAAKYLRGELKAGSAYFKRITGALPEMLERNKQLVRLPYGRMELEVCKDAFDQSGAEAVFREYGFRSFMREPLSTAWERLLVF